MLGYENPTAVQAFLDAHDTECSEVMLGPVDPAVGRAVHVSPSQKSANATMGGSDAA